MFQHRHYEAIAKLLKDLREQGQDSKAWQVVLDQVEDKFIVLFQENPNFDMKRFSKAAQ